MFKICHSLSMLIVFRKNIFTKLLSNDVTLTRLNSICYTLVAFSDRFDFSLTTNSTSRLPLTIHFGQWTHQTRTNLLIKPPCSMGSANRYFRMLWTVSMRVFSPTAKRARGNRTQWWAALVRMVLYHVLPRNAVQNLAYRWVGIKLLRFFENFSFSSMNANGTDRYKN